MKRSTTGVAASAAHDIDAAVVNELLALLGADVVHVGASILERTTRDWSDAPASPPLAVLLPRTTQQVAEALRICHRHHRAVAVQGGLTGLAGGANPQAGDIVLSLARLSQIEEIDTVGGTVLAGAGVTLEALQGAVEEHGWSFALDLGARGSCQIGGNAATNAGGNRVLRYGMMRNLVLGLEVVLADGTVLTMLDRVIKNNAGFDLKQFFIGSEGALGVITRLSLALVPKPETHLTALCALASFDDALQLLREAKRCLPSLTAFELMWSDFFEASAQAIGKDLPFSSRYPLYVLIELAGTASGNEDGLLEEFLGTCLEKSWVQDAVVPQSETQARQLWAYREGVAELLALKKPCAAFDVSVGIAQMDALVSRLREELGQSCLQQDRLFFGHLGDGNLHLICGPFAAQADLERAEEQVYTIVGEYGGSISAEHGIGTVKAQFLHHSRKPAEIEVMRRLKTLFDPHRILNRGKVLY